MKFKAYHKIKQFKDVIRDISFKANYKGKDKNGEPILTELESLEILKKDVIKLQSKMPLKVNTSVIKGINFHNMKECWSVTFTVKNQHFTIEHEDTELEAVWFQKQFLTAIDNLIEMVK